VILILNLPVIMDFKNVSSEILRTEIVTIASATVIEAGDVCELSAGLPVKGTATGAALAYSPNASANGDTQIDLTIGNDFVLEGTGDAVFAVAQKGTEVDLVVAAGVQQIDVGASATDVFKISFAEDAGTVGSANNIRVRINKPIF
jgi:hypothetical protein